MKKLILLVLLLALVGCKKPPESPVVLQVNDYKITRDQFEAEFKSSPFAKKDTFESRKQFLELLINRKLIVQEAQTLGLDKQPNFLATIQRFWEQALMKSYLDHKTSEIASRVYISDIAIADAYKRLQAEGKADRPYEEMYNQLKWDLTRAREEQMMDQSIKDLHNRAVIREDLSLLKSK